jgi:hypothetical protein
VLGIRHQAPAFAAKPGLSFDTNARNGRRMLLLNGIPSMLILATWVSSSGVVRMDSLQEIRAAARNIFLASYYQQARLCLSTAVAEKIFKTSLDPSSVFRFRNGEI